jgi:hypothetical protein
VLSQKFKTRLLNRRSCIMADRPNQGLPRDKENKKDKPSNMSKREDASESDSPTKDPAQNQTASVSYEQVTASGNSAMHIGTINIGTDTYSAVGLEVKESATLVAGNMLFTEESRKKATKATYRDIKSSGNATSINGLIDGEHYDKVFDMLNRSVTKESSSQRGRAGRASPGDHERTHAEGSAGS